MEIQKNVDLGKKTTIGVGSLAHYFTVANSKDDLLMVSDFAKKNKLGILPIGLGSNVFFYNDIKDKIIVQLKNNNFESLGNGIFKVGAGMILQELISILVKENYDLSALAGYPSTIGGAITVNSGLLGKSIGDFLVSAELFNFKTGDFEVWKSEDFNFGYRYSKLKELNGYIIIEAILNVPSSEGIQEKLKLIISDRTSKQPHGRCAGCFFKNPEGNSAGKLIDETGLKGYKIGGAFVSDKHANFLMTNSSATKSDLFELKEFVKDSVKEKFGILLEEEVVIY